MQIKETNMTKIFLKKLTLASISTLAVITTAACTPSQTTRGNFLEERQINDVKVGEHSRYDILQYMGSPTSTAPFNENKWYYIGQKTEKRGILDDEVLEEKIVVVEFDNKGIVSKVELLDSNREDIPVNKNKTATAGHEVTIIQQMLGNLGKFNPPSTAGDIR